jgi:hypothetical protein
MLQSKPSITRHWLNVCKFVMQNSESNLYVQDVKANDERDNTLVLLKILALGKREIEEGKFKDKKDVFAELK